MENVDVNQAIQLFQKVVTQHYSDFNGRVSRKDFWTYVAVYVAIAVGVAIVEGIVGLRFLMSAFQLALLLPTAGITARRLQDIGKNGQLVWLLYLPVAVSAAVTFLATLSAGGFGVVMLFAPFLVMFDLISIAAAILTIYWCIQPGIVGPNEFGPQPA